VPPSGIEAPRQIAGRLLLDESSARPPEQFGTSGKYCAWVTSIRGTNAGKMFLFRLNASAAVELSLSAFAAKGADLAA
jgi:hypothetical protein